MIQGWSWFVTRTHDTPKRLRSPRKRALKCRCSRAGRLADVTTIPSGAFPAPSCILFVQYEGGNHVCHSGSDGKHRIGGCQEVRHPPRSGWLGEWGRLKGGCPVGGGVALRRAFVDEFRN